MSFIGPMILLLALPFATAADEAIESYPQSLARARALFEQGRLDEAVSVLVATASRYPQDFRVALELGRLEYGRERFEAAREHYRRAMALSGAGGDAQLGLGWTRLALGEPAEAYADFGEVLRAQPELELALQGRRAARAAWPTLVSWAALTGHSWAAHPAKHYAGAVSAGFVWRPVRRLHVGAQYRGVSFFVRDPQDLEEPLGDFAQHEAWATVGYDTPKLAVLGTYGFVYPRGQPDFQGHLAALSLGYRGLGALWLDVMVGRYEGLDWLQGAAEWELPLAWGLSMRPSARVQGSDRDGGGGAGALTVSWRRAGFVSWLGGSYGREVRPASLRPAVVYNLPEYVRAGALAGLQVRVAARWRLFAEYELRVLEPRADEGDYRAQLHLLTVGLAHER